MAAKAASEVWRNLSRTPTITKARLKSHNLVAVDFQISDPVHERKSTVKSIFHVTSKGGEQIHTVSVNTDANLKFISDERDSHIVKLFSTEKAKWAELWCRECLIKTVKLTKQVDTFHEKPVLSANGTHCLVVADPAADEKAKRTHFDDEESTGKFVRQENWGEQMVECRSPSVYLIDFTTDEVKQAKLDGWSLAEPQLSDEGRILMTGHNEQPFRLGRIYCTNRPTSLFSSSLEAFPALEQVTKQGSSAHTPRFIEKTNDYFYMRRGEWGAHHDYHDLVLNENGADDEVIIAADYCAQFTSDEENTCPGIDLGCAKFYTKEKRLYVTSLWRNHWAILEIDWSAKSIKPIAFDSQQSVALLDMDADGRMLIKESSLVKATKLSILENNEKTLVYQSIDDDEQKMEFEQGTLKCTDTTGQSFAFHRVTSPGNKNLILFPHGGPHSTLVNTYQTKFRAYVKLGYDIVCVNYRGSVGFGADFVRQLPGHVGTRDVSDCLAALDYAKAKKDYANLFVFGGSHGGFLTAWITASGRHFAACAIRNPVVNLNSMYAVTDIPDWCFYEMSGEQFKPGHVLTDEQLAKSRKMSPISQVHQVTTPTLMNIGTEDKRVPRYQGVEWCRSLPATTPHRILEYPDCHPLSKIDVDGDVFVETHVWFSQHAKQ